MVPQANAVERLRIAADDPSRRLGVAGKWLSVDLVEVERAARHVDVLFEVWGFASHLARLDFELLNGGRVQTADDNGHDDPAGHGNGSDGETASKPGDEQRNCHDHGDDAEDRQ